MAILYVSWVNSTSLFLTLWFVLLLDVGGFLVVRFARIDGLVCYWFH